MVALEPFNSGSAPSMFGASPDASCHAPAPVPSWSLPLRFFFGSGSAAIVDSLEVLTTDHPPADVAEAAAVAEAAGAMVWAGGSGSAGLGAGVHEGSLGAGIGDGSGAGRNG